MAIINIDLYITKKNEKDKTFMKLEGLLQAASNALTYTKRKAKI